MKNTYKMALVSALTLFTLSATPLTFTNHLNVAQAAATKKTHHKKVRKHAVKKHKVAKKLRHKKAKKHTAKKKAAKKFRRNKAKKHVAKKKATRKFSYKKAKKHVAKKKSTKKRGFKKVKKARKSVAKTQNNMPTKSNNSDNDDVNNYIKVPDDYFIKFVNGKYEINGQVENNPDSNQTLNLPVNEYNSAFAINHFHANKQDKKTTIDYNNLTYQQQKDLSQYTANIINNVRHQITNNNPTTADLTVDDNTINFVNDIAKRYDDDNWSNVTQGGHDVKAINQAAKEFGLDYSDDYNTKDDQQFYEDLGGGYLPNNGQTHLSTIKHAIYSIIMEMLFDDAHSQWGHAFSFIGTYYPNQKSDTFAIGFDKLGQIHFEIIPYDYVKANEAAEQAKVNAEEAAEQEKINANEAAEQAKINAKVAAEQAKINEEAAEQAKINANEVAEQEAANAQSHVSTDQTFNNISPKPSLNNQKLDEFASNLVDNEMKQLSQKSNNASVSYSTSYSSNTVTITDANYPNGKTFTFNSNNQ